MLNSLRTITNKAGSHVSLAFFLLVCSLIPSIQAGSKAHEAISARLGKSEFTRAEAQTALKDIFRQEVGRVAGEQMQQAVRQIEVETVAAHLEQNGSLSNRAQPQTTIREGVNAKVAELRTRGRELQTKVTTAKEEIIAGWGKDNKLVTREQMQAARERISQKLAAAGRQMNIGADPSVLADMAAVATGHLEAGARSLETFKTAMQSEAKIQKAGITDEQVTELFNKAADEDLLKVRGTLSKEGQAEFDTLRAAIGDEKLLNRLPDDPAKTVKMFDGLAATSANKRSSKRVRHSELLSNKQSWKQRDCNLTDRSLSGANPFKKRLLKTTPVTSVATSELS